MMNKEFTYVELRSGKQIKAYHDRIQDIAMERGDFRKVDDMDDDSFNGYVEIMIEME